MPARTRASGAFRPLRSVAEQQRDEAQHELSRRLSILELRRGLTAEQREDLERAVNELVETRAIEVVPRWGGRIVIASGGSRPEACLTQRGCWFDPAL